jgi:hypothetical protein
MIRTEYKKEKEMRHECKLCNEPLPQGLPKNTNYIYCTRLSCNQYQRSVRAEKELLRVCSFLGRLISHEPETCWYMKPTRKHTIVERVHYIMSKKAEARRIFKAIKAKVSDKITNTCLDFSCVNPSHIVSSVNTER